MNSWFNKPKYKNVKTKMDTDFISQEAWLKCQECDLQIFHKEIENNLHMCKKCGYHFRISAKQRIKLLIDPSTFKEHFPNITTLNPLDFTDAKENYRDKIKKNIKKNKINECVIVGMGDVNKQKIILAVMDFNFMGGSMGSAVGEKIYQATQLSLKKKVPLVIVSSSGGARMQEGILSLMQMGKTCAGLEQMEKENIPFISILTDPTMGGVTASFASLGDIIIAEPKAIIGFAGPRVIEQTIKQKLPKGFQRSEFLLQHGFIDCIVTRDNLKETLTNFLVFFKH